MKISLITVSYNSEETIRETFESVRNQKTDGFELEYIHIDGLSNDATMKISQEFDDIITKRISEKDSGIYNAMNKGIQMATGDIIGFLNSDDTFNGSEVLLEITKQFLSIRDLEIVYADIDYVDNQGAIKRKWRSGKQKKFAKGWHPPHPGFYASKELFDNYGNFDEKFSIAADFDLMIRFMESAEAKAAYLKKTIVNMRLGGESNRSYKNIILGNKQIMQSFKKYSISPQTGYTYLRWIRKVLQAHK